MPALGGEADIRAEQVLLFYISKLAKACLILAYTSV